MLKTVYRTSCRDKHNCQRRDSNLDPLTPQSDALTTRLLRPVWGCGRWRAAPAKAQAEQRTERWFISTLFRLNYLSEQHVGSVTIGKDHHTSRHRYATALRRQTVIRAYHPTGPAGRVPSNFGDHGDRVYLVCSKLCNWLSFFFR